MSRKRKIIIIFFLIAVLSGLYGYNYVMHGGARDLVSEETDFKVSSDNILNEFTSNIEAANIKYLEKAVAVEGVVTSVKGLQIILDKTLICNLKVQDNTIIEGRKTIIKGRVVGYDDLMGELILDQCFIIKNDSK